MLYSDFPSPKKHRLVARSESLGRWAYAIGDLRGMEYCVVAKREIDPDEEIPGRAKVRPTATLFKMAPMDWEAV